MLLQDDVADDDDNKNNNSVKDVKYCSYRKHEMHQKKKNPFHLQCSCFHHGHWLDGGLLGLHAMWQMKVSEKCTSSTFRMTIWIVWMQIGL
jgi:hypothetical protein